MDEIRNFVIDLGNIRLFQYRIINSFEELINERVSLFVDIYWTNRWYCLKVEQSRDVYYEYAKNKWYEKFQLVSYIEREREEWR